MILIDKPGDTIVLALPVGRYRSDVKDASGKSPYACPLTGG